MKLKTRATARTVSGTAQEAVTEARKQARRQATRAKAAAARTGAQTMDRASGVSKKAVGAVGAVALAGGYFVSRLRRQADPTAPKAKPAANDQALADRVKSEIFQPADAPKGSVNVNVEDGVVYLRGEVEQPDQIRKLAEEAGAVDGVRDVENLLHTSGPMRSAQ